MLSNKMTFSLMSLITIFALAFVAPSAMAATFGADLVMDAAGASDISHQDGLQLAIGTAGDLTFMVKYKKAIKLDITAHVFATFFDSDGDIDSIPLFAAGSN